ncbi:MAG: hypothetical protein P8R42_21225 [Candidatus Binatia bacterium]|nr:hypothetical protein [Candidatus Binatia bacterium]
MIRAHQLLSCLAAAVWISAGSATYAADPTPAPTPHLFKQAFEAADADHDGKLSKDEAKKGGFFSAESFKDTDYDKDGNVTLFELGKAVTKSTKDWLDEHDDHDKDDDGHVDKNEAKFGSRIYTVFDRADANKDNRVDQREIKNYAAQSYYSESAPYPLVPNIINEKF